MGGKDCVLTCKVVADANSGRVKLPTASISDAVEVLKEKIMAATGVPVEEMRLVVRMLHRFQIIDKPVLTKFL